MTETTEKPRNKLAERLLARGRATSTTDAAGVPAATQASAIAARMRDDQIDRNALVLLVTQIEVRKQARTAFRNIESLAQNIRTNGQIQPIVVQEVAPHRYVLKHGERRLRAIRDVLKADTIFARVAETAADATRWRLAQLSENIQREDYRPFEIAHEFAALKEENDWTNKQLGDELAVSESWVSKKLSLLEAPQQIRDAIEAETLSETDYYNNKNHYNENLDAVAAATAEARAGADSAEDDGKKKDPKARIPTVSLPLKTAVDLAEILQALAARHKLNAIELAKKPSKKELLAILTTRAREIKKHL